MDNRPSTIVRDVQIIIPMAREQRQKKCMTSFPEATDELLGERRWGKKIRWAFDLI